MHKIVIVGGGTAGWIAALFLARRAPSLTGEPLDITLVESPDVAPVGVGEATTPSLGLTLAAMDIDEHEFMRRCQATFKHGIRFEQWTRSPADDPDEAYFHPFEHPARFGIEQLAHAWHRLPSSGRPAFADVACVQTGLARAGLAPKAFGDAPYRGYVPYAYHLDAGLLAEFLSETAVAAGVTHLRQNVTNIDVASTGAIESLHCDDGTVLEADLFIDCTGFRAMLINHDKTNTFSSVNDVLLCDRAIVTRQALTEGDPLLPYTRSQAQESGWIWDINLDTRRGIGYVYSSSHCSDDEAVETLGRYVGVVADDLDYRTLKMRCGYHQYHWRHNVVAIGLSSGFVEPLESTGIYLIEMATWMLGQLLPRYLSGSDISAQFNQSMVRHYENIVDFIKAHYAFSRREDSAFWQDNRDPSSWTDGLIDLSERWKHDVPSDYDFEQRIQCFSAANYQYVAYGMTENSAAHIVGKPTGPLAPYIEDQRRRQRQAQSQLEPHRHYIDRIQQGGGKTADRAITIPPSLNSYQLY